MAFLCSVLRVHHGPHVGRLLLSPGVWRLIGLTFHMSPFVSTQGMASPSACLELPWAVFALCVCVCVCESYLYAVYGSHCGCRLSQHHCKTLPPTSDFVWAIGCLPTQILLMTTPFVFTRTLRLKQAVSSSDVVRYVCMCNK